MACAIPHPPCLLSVDRSLLLLFLFSLSSSLLPSSSLAFSSPSVFSFSFIRRPILVHVPPARFVRSNDGETRVHIFVMTMMCVILRAGIREANTNGRERKRGKDGENKREKRESEMMRECYEEKRKGTQRATKRRKRRRSRWDKDRI